VSKLKKGEIFYDRNSSLQGSTPKGKVCPVKSMTKNVRLSGKKGRKGV